MKIMLLLVPVMVSACAGIHATPHETSSGKPGYKLTCSEFNATLDDCKARASELCSHGFVVDKHLSYRETHPDSGDGFYMHPKQHLVVACKDPE